MAAKQPAATAKGRGFRLSTRFEAELAALRKGDAKEIDAILRGAEAALKHPERGTPVPGMSGLYVLFAECFVESETLIFYRFSDTVVDLESITTVDRIKG